MENDKDLDLIGMTVEQATAEINARGLRPRIVMLDGMPKMVTMDVQMNRINLNIEDGIIIATHIG